MKKNILLILPSQDFSWVEFQVIKTAFEKNDYSVFIASDTTGFCKANNGSIIKADVPVFNIHPSNFLAVLFIGGNGVRKDWDNRSYKSVAEKFNKSRKIVGAICAAPIILSRAGLLSGKSATCFPQDREELERDNVEYLDSSVVIDDNLVTGKSSFDSEHFAEIIIRKIEDGKY